MNTKYILHGGCAQKENPNNTKFFKEILKDTKSSIQILLVYFASERINDKLNYKNDTQQFLKVSKGKTLKFRLATQQSFLAQLKSSDIIYFGGGFTHKILPILMKYKDLEKCLQGKIIVGESAGANSLSTYGYSKYSKQLFKGLNIIPVLTIPHYTKGDELLIKEELQNIKPNFLKETEFKVF